MSRTERVAFTQICDRIMRHVSHDWRDPTPKDTLRRLAGMPSSSQMHHAIRHLVTGGWIELVDGGYYRR